MQSNKKIRKRYLITIGILLLLGVYFGPSVLAGYALTEHSAIRYTLPNEDGEVVFEKDIANKKIVIWNTGKLNYVKLLESPLGIFKRATNINPISGQTIDENMKVTWSGEEIEDEFYDVVFAAEALDKQIEKVIVSNEQDDRKSTPLSIVKEQSSIFIEMEVKDGFAAYYSKLPQGDVGSFSFRGINSDGKVVSFD
ncbi:hypothetical protein [Gracilibacillus massiliensis]|uniref:hypothetical protein n=1 Tax=Gracilibacillus massiliensis TaxID=1564956 RepID=UPI00071C9AE8|nr:hypothetical protein [Gracilibacillus massiliensis]